MTWSVQINGASPAGQDGQEQHDYLSRKFREFLDKIANEGTTQVSYSQLTTNVGTIDLMTGQVVSGSKQTVPSGQQPR